MSAPRWLALLSLWTIALTARPFSGEERTCGFTSRLGAELTRIEPAGMILQLVYSPDGKLLAISRFHRDTEVVYGATGRLVHRLPRTDRSFAIAISPDGKYLATGGWGHERDCLWDLATGKRIRHFDTQTQEVYTTDLHFSPDGKVLAVAGQPTHLYDTASGKSVGRLQSEGNVAQIRYAPNGNMLAGYSWTQLHVWDVANLKGLSHPRLLHDQPVFLRCGNGRPDQRDGIAFSPDGQRIYFGVGVYYQVQAMAVRNGKPLAVPGPAEQFATTSFALSPDGRVLALGGSDGTICLIEVLTGQVRSRLRGHQHEVVSIAFSPDGQRLASAGADQAILLRDLTRLVPVPPGPLAAEALTAAWDNLGSDAETACRAMQVLSTGQATRWLQTKLKPARLPEADVHRWIADLDSRDFQIRQTATDSLERLGLGAEPALRRAAENQPSLEARLRLEQLMTWAEQAPRSADELREHRAVELLEKLDTAAARQLLQNLAGGSPLARLTELARSALAARQ